MFFEQFFSDQKNPYVGFRRFVLDLLNQRGEEFHARERWDPDPRLEQKKPAERSLFLPRSLDHGWRDGTENRVEPLPERGLPGPDPFPDAQG